MTSNCNGKVPINIILKANTTTGSLEMKPIDYIKKQHDMGYIIIGYDTNAQLYMCKNLADHHSNSLTSFPCNFIEDMYKLLKKKRKKKSSSKKKKSSSKKKK